MRQSAAARQRFAIVSGFTLIEVLVSMAMLAVVAAAVFGSFAVVSGLNRDASRDQEATLAARAYLEDLRSEWSDVASYDAWTVVSPQPALPPGCNVSVVPLGAAARTVTLACAASPDPFIVVLGRPMP